ncbi:MAG TPA: alkaline phosphatase family protein [Gemmatimonadaceae bacterium]|nr:alkaline phosphatase family protein [Gemmatimonadaceae bacterium]
MTDGHTRLLVLCLDAASPDLLDAWIADGTLPNLAALVARGLAGRTRGLEGLFVGSTWPSLFTATNPAQHGFHYQMQLVPGTYRIADRTRGALVGREPFWRALGRAGKHVALLDVPLARPERGELNGVQVVEWGAHDGFFGFSTTPPDLASWIETHWGRHPAGVSCDADRHGAEDYRELVIALEAGVRRKTEWTLDLLQRGGWDLFMQVFSESHCVGHQCWHLHDPGHPAYDRTMLAVAGNPMRSVYRAIDRGIGEIVAAAGDVPCIVFTAHGMSHRYGANFLVRDVLVALGAAALPAPTVRDRAYGLAAAAWHALPAAARAPLSAIRSRVRQPNARRAGRARGIGVVPGRSRCFPVPNGLVASGIRLNLAGREPRGILAPGADAARFVDQLESDLLAIVDDATGAPLVARVVRTRDLYQGEHVDDLPDLLVEWSERTAVGSLALGGAGAQVIARSPRIGIIHGANDYGRSGEHRPGGWFVAAGPGLSQGRLAREPSLLDLAPTFAALLGVALPDAEGTPIPEIAAARTAGSA